MYAARITHSFALLAALLLFLGSSSPAAAGAPAPRPVKKVDFERHIMGLLGRLGCNAGSCHGSFQGKGGFRLSLFGYDPERDYLALTRDQGGRRINRTDPDRSLLLLKATGQVDHGGLRRFSKGSWQYNLFRRWIADGMPRDKDSGAVKQITITPPEYAFKKAGEAGTLSVSATFADGSRKDITALCDFRTNDEAVAPVSARGEVRTPGRRYGRYRFLPGSHTAGARHGADDAAARLQVHQSARGQCHRPRGVRQAAPAEHRPLGAVLRRRVSAPRHTRHHRQPADTGSGAQLPRRQKAEQARQENRRTAGPPAARRPVGHPFLRHHRQQHRHAGEPAATQAQVQSDVARLVPQASSGERALRRDR